MSRRSDRSTTSPFPERSLSRRRLLAGVGATGAASVAGCSSLSGPITFESTPPSVADAALSDTGYSHTQTTTPVVTREVSAFGLSRDIEVTNAVAEYDRAFDLGPLGLGRYRAAVFAVLSTPQISYLGQTFNPVGEMETDELAEMLQQQYRNLRNLSADGEFTATVLDTSTTVTQYAGVAVLTEAEFEVDVFVLFSEPVAHGEDFVLSVAVYPQFLAERDHVRRLLSGVRH